MTNVSYKIAYMLKMRREMKLKQRFSVILNAENVNSLRDFPFFAFYMLINVISFNTTQVPSQVEI